MATGAQRFLPPFALGACGAVSAARSLGLVELVVEGAEGVGLVGQAGVGVRVRGDHDVGVAEEFLDGDQGDAAFDEQGGAAVSEVVEADAADAGAFAQPLHVPSCVQACV